MQKRRTLAGEKLGLLLMLKILKLQNRAANSSEPSPTGKRHRGARIFPLYNVASERFLGTKWFFSHKFVKADVKLSSSGKYISVIKSRNRNSFTRALTTVKTTGLRAKLSSRGECNFVTLTEKFYYPSYLLSFARR